MTNLLETIQNFYRIQCYEEIKIQDYWENLKGNES